MGRLLFASKDSMHLQRLALIVKVFRCAKVSRVQLEKPLWNYHVAEPASAVVLHIL